MEHKRRVLSNRIRVGNWDSSNIINSIAKIVIEEVFGYHTSSESILAELVAESTGIFRPLQPNGLICRYTKVRKPEVRIARGLEQIWILGSGSVWGF